MAGTVPRRVGSVATNGWLVEARGPGLVPSGPPRSRSADVAGLIPEEIGLFLGAQVHLIEACDHGGHVLFE